jgi:acetyl esterase/lipase
MRTAGLILLWLAWGQTAPAEIEYVIDVTYSQVDKEDLKLDLAYPKDAKGPFPAVVCVHGGGWHAGNRKGYTSLIKEYAQNGYVGVTVSYRLAPKHKFPAPVQDVKAAVRWLRAHAAEYKIDPNKIGAIGDSAGGHLVSMLAVTSAEDGFDGEEKESCRIQAVVPVYAPFDLVTGWKRSETDQPKFEGNYVRFAMTQFLGGKIDDIPETYKKASPVTYVTRDDPPVLLIHGTKDLLVGIDQSELMETKLKDAGVSVEFVKIDGAGHGFKGDHLRQAMQSAKKFFDKTLR